MKAVTALTILLIGVHPISGVYRSQNQTVPSVASYSGKELPIVKIVNKTDYNFDILITDPIGLKGGRLPKGAATIVTVPNGNRTPGTVTVKVVALQNGHLVGDWQETFPVPKSSADFLPTRILRNEHFK